MSIELSLGTAKAVIFDLDGTLYNKKGLPLRLIAADVPHMFMLGNERKARKELMGRWFGDEHAYYEALYARVAEMSHSTADKARRWYEDRYMPQMQRILKRHYHVEPWAEGMMADLRQRGIRTAVYSDYGCLRERLEALGFDCSWVDVVTTPTARARAAAACASSVSSYKRCDQHGSILRPAARAGGPGARGRAAELPPQP